MSGKDNGGPAFPRPLSMAHEDAVYHAQNGMTLRDWFAGQALAGEMATWTESDVSPYANSVAKRCYKIADAMLEARK